MFPLLDTEAANPLELFQIWLNLPARSKFAAPYFTMFWSEDIPRLVAAGASGARTEVVCVAGRLVAGGTPFEPLAPPPDSWASAPDSDLAIWTFKMDPGARWTLPPARSAATRRSLYFFAGSRLTIAGEVVDRHGAIELRADRPVDLASDGTTAELLLLQGRPIGEPVVQYGPFVMNTEQEIRQAFADYRATHFGGWPWPNAAPVHGADPTRFARHADGRIDRRGR
jgi:redox-sensitive bicupin YhaK (pirin superfamily)